MKQEFYSNGKLLITGEYLVLDGASALAIPTSYGQWLFIETIEESKIYWNSIDEEGETWYESQFLIEDIDKLQLIGIQNDKSITDRLIQILSSAKQLNPDFLKEQTGYRITTKLSFPRNWGLGTSSTLINNIANWAKVDAFKLLEKTFGGSGYDIAAAQYNHPISYSLSRGISSVKEVKLPWSFTDQLFFIHLNKKQNSREGISHYKSQNKNKSHAIGEISELTAKIISCPTIQEFELLITQHENTISKFINLKTVKKLLFDNYSGAIKSLGAWGGDFILATGRLDDMEYFRKKGFGTIIPFKDMIK